MPLLFGQFCRWKKGRILYGLVKNLYCSFVYKFTIQKIIFFSKCQLRVILKTWLKMLQNLSHDILIQYTLCTRMRSNPRQKLGRVSFFFFFMVVANCNASCYWLHVHCSQWQLLLFLLNWIEGVLSSWKALCGKLRDCFMRYTNPQLIAKCEQILCETSCE